MNCAEFIGILKSGQPLILRRHSKEYLRLAENSLSVVTVSGKHLCLWLAANHKFKRILRVVPQNPPEVSPTASRLINRLRGGLPNIRDFRELVFFLRYWEEMRRARLWAPNYNFPGLTEVATFV
jgi:hypothetical protein